MGKKLSKNVKNVLGILKDEISGDVNSAFKKLTADYRMTWMYKTRKGELFPQTSKDFKKGMKEVYVIKGRKYDIKNIAEGKNIVIVEMVESYPDPKTRKVYRTPLVIVLEMKGGKIRRGRHFCDPNLSYVYLSKKQIQKGYK